jgi:nucleotide-binding universal stress UspA family protein
METCLGVLLAESLNAKVTAAYVTGDFTWEELRKIYGVDELKWAGAGKASKNAMAVAEGRKGSLGKKALESAEKMCADRGIPCETVHLSSRSPLHGVLKLAEEKRCDVIVTSVHPQGALNMMSPVKAARTNGQARVPLLFHYAV